MKRVMIYFSSILYKLFLKRIIFLFNSEFIHELAVDFGQILGNSKILNFIILQLFKVENKSLKQRIVGINFDSPLGLAAGFDYKASLYNLLPSLSFGFETIGTITNLAYEGNSKPRLARLVKSKSLLVNKGFKNSGINVITKKLENRVFKIPIGLSIGKTNTGAITTQKQALEDIILAFKTAERKKLKISYYELNISCPNLVGNIEFYQPLKLEKLLKAIFALNIKKPIFIKMPISRTNNEIIKMMDVIVKYPIAAVIIGNLEKDRNNKYLIKAEIDKFKKGGFSGKPTQERSNELIKLIYKKYKSKIVIIGCGGVFSAKDAYQKIKLGASLIQLITGLVFEGPQLVAQINLELLKLLKKDGFKNISQAIGSAI